MHPAALVKLFLTYANRLKFRNLFLITLSLFVIDLLVPDFIPMIDEIILALIAILLANWKKEPGHEQAGAIIEGEVIKEKDK
ncbi:MAG: hypothetical protein A3J35_05500 [Gammaproteobacteria bacterium RIFCSPLOWO2_02_FULL_52_10]|nr:MAG: hypothetical protein A3J35_05500 [Gammaproteobacteria bacterium RIFCSPLOWO2_02_FULL_52_10]